MKGPFMCDSLGLTNLWNELWPCVAAACRSWIKDGRGVVVVAGGQTGGGAKQLYKPGNADGERDGAQVNRWQSERESQCRERESRWKCCHIFTEEEREKEIPSFLLLLWCCLFSWTFICLIKLCFIECALFWVKPAVAEAALRLGWWPLGSYLSSASDGVYLRNEIIHHKSASSETKKWLWWIFN